MIECSLAGTELSAELCAKGRGARKKPREQLPDISTIIVKTTEGKTYADTVRALKTNIDPSNEGVSIKKMARAKDGNVLMRFTEENQGAANKLQQQISSKTGNTTEIKKASQLRIIVHDLDGVTKADEIESKIREITEETGEILVKEPAPTRNGSWTATVSLSKPSAEKMLMERSVKIGWLSCRVTAKVDVPFCSNCLKLGHIESMCVEEKIAAKKCYKCTKVDHEAKECNNTPYCMTCEKSGHQAVSFECPEYRKITKEKRERNRNRLAKLLEQ